VTVGLFVAMVMRHRLDGIHFTGSTASEIREAPGGAWYIYLLTQLMAVFSA